MNKKIKKVISTIMLLLFFTSAATAFADWDQSKIEKEKQKVLSQYVTRCVENSGASAASSLRYQNCESLPDLFETKFKSCYEAAYTDEVKKGSKNPNEYAANGCFTPSGQYALSQLQVRNTGGSTTDGQGGAVPDASGSGGSVMAPVDLGEAQATAGDCGSPDLIMVNGQCSAKSLFCKSGSNSPVCAGSVKGLIGLVFQGLLLFAGLIAVAFIIYGGYMYMTAGGSSETSEKGKQTVTRAIIGLVLIMLAYFIVSVVIRTLQNPIGVLGI